MPTIRPANRYIARGAAEARALGHGFIGTEHVLLAIVRDDRSDAARLLARLDVDPTSVRAELLALRPPARAPSGIDAEALATLGIDLDIVRQRLEESFGAGALERTATGCMGIEPRLKLALARAVDLSAGGPLGDEHVLLGLLSVLDSCAARVLGEFGVTFERANENV